MRNAFFLGPEKTEGLQEPLLDVAQSVLSAPTASVHHRQKWGKVERELTNFVFNITLEVVELASLSRRPTLRGTVLRTGKEVLRHSQSRKRLLVCLSASRGPKCMPSPVYVQQEDTDIFYTSKRAQPRFKAYTCIGYGLV